MLEARHLTKCYSAVPAVQDVSFCLKKGQVLGCLGPNGSGKSTTVKMLIGLLDPTRGEILYGGRNIREDLMEYRRHLGYVPEEPHLYSYLTGEEYLDLVGTLRGMNKRVLGKKIPAFLDFFSLYPHCHSAIGSYSKGMRQRILLISALLDNPEVLVFDEPLSGLDVTSALIFKNLIQTFGQQGKIVFYCSHVLEVVEKVCSHLLILRKGIVLANDSLGGVHEMAGQSLEGTFFKLVEDVDTQKIAHDIFELMSAA